MNRILIIDDEKTICSSLKFSLEDEYIVKIARNTFELEAKLSEDKYDVVLLDLKFNDISGLDLIGNIKSFNKTASIIMMTAFASVESSIEAMKKGVYDYISKPIDIQKLKFIIHKSIDFKQLNEKINYLENEVKLINKNEKFIGKSKKMKKVFEMISKLKNIDMNVLIQGDSGTGKELVARELHYQGIRKDNSFEVINCGAIPDNLMESELFGFKKGAFTGATHNKKGLFELANRGTLFLDEIGEMSLMSQVKLLRVIQNMEISPLGSEHTKKIDVRIIAATNKDLNEEVKKGKFREDLFFRLNVVTINTPKLSQRKEDIPLLIKHFIEETSDKFNLKAKGISREALVILENYTYPGNVRELKNIIERAMVFSDNQDIQIENLPNKIIKDSGISNLNDYSSIIPIEIGTTLSKIEKKVILKTLEEYNGNRRKTAEVLGISERNIRYKIKQYKAEELI